MSAGESTIAANSATESSRDGALTGMETASARQALDALEEDEGAKIHFLSVLTHELRTPLANIIGWASEALEVPELAPEALRVILRNAESEARMLTNLLEVSRLYHGRFVLCPEPADLWEVTEQAVNSLAGTASARRIKLVRIPPPVALPVFADVRRLYQVVCNLLDNAVKFTPGGGTVTLVARAEKGTARLAITDTGRGIAPEMMPVLFQPFPMPDQQDATCGLRLGLSLVKRIVEMHGGTVDVESPGVGLGSTFTVVLPSIE